MAFRTRIRGRENEVVVMGEEAGVVRGLIIDGAGMQLCRRSKALRLKRRIVFNSDFMFNMLCREEKINPPPLDRIQ